jgi:hypothetical protein
LVFTGNNIPVLVYGFLGFFIVPLSTLNAMYLGFEIFNPERKKLALIIYASTGIVYYIALFGWPGEMFKEGTNASGEMLDITLQSVVLGSSIFYIMSMIFVISGGFVRLRRRITGFDRQRAIDLAIAFLLFSFAAIFEAVFSSNIIIIGHIMNALSVFFVYRGFHGKEKAPDNRTSQ